MIYFIKIPTYYFDHINLSRDLDRYTIPLEKVIPTALSLVVIAINIFNLENAVTILILIRH